jgi:L-asparaginase
MPGRVKIFVTGGTFDKEYNELTGELFFKDTHIHDMLRLAAARWMWTSKP